MNYSKVKRPDKTEFIELYETKSQLELTRHYHVSKKKIRQWILEFELPLRNLGGGNNRKYNPSKQELENYINLDYSNNEIQKLTGIKSQGALSKWLRNFGLVGKGGGRHKQLKDIPYKDWGQYRRRVRYYTEKEYAKNKEGINPNNYPRTVCGVEGGYNLDHKKSIWECFHCGMTVLEAAHHSNLQMLPWRENLIKNNRRVIEDGQQ